MPPILVVYVNQRCDVWLGYRFDGMGQPNSLGHLQEGRDLPALEGDQDEVEKKIAAMFDGEPWPGEIEGYDVLFVRENEGRGGCLFGLAVAFLATAIRNLGSWSH